MNILVSVIVPCYNDGAYLSEAVASVPFKKMDHPIELIVVNDGSTDELTLKIIQEIEQQGHKVIHQQNMGLAASRNTGINQAKGKYILPLDADNKLDLYYFTKGVAILEANNKIDVVYGDAMFFGNKEEIWKSKRFNPSRFVRGNFIDACALFRKSIWENVGGYDASMRNGHEDWEFWTNIFVHGGGFYNLEEICFYYRLRNDAMRMSISKEQYEANRMYIMKKHAAFFSDYFKSNYTAVEYIKRHPFKAAVNLLLGRVKLH